MVKPATVKIARIICYVFSSNNTIKWRTQELSVDILKQTIAAAKRSGDLISELGETTDLGHDPQFMVFVR